MNASRSTTRGSLTVLFLTLLITAPVGLAQQQDEMRPRSFAPLVQATKAAVVNVSVQARSPQLPEEMELLERFFGSPHGAPPPVRMGSGSGVLIRPDGLVLTNNHVVEGAISIRIQLDDGRSFDAKVLGRDPLTDLALVRLQQAPNDLPVVKLGDSDAMRVGDWVLAIGNPFGLASSVSAGIISARARDIQVGPYDDFLQTDAAINPGNSGGPLFNLEGEVIGINTAIVGGGSGIGFAVPVNIAKALLPQMEKGVIHRGWLGLAVQDLTPALAKALKLNVETGALASDVEPGTPAHRAGIEPQDLITAVNGERVASARELTRNIGFRGPGEIVKLTVIRQGKERIVEAKLGERPTERQAMEPPAEEQVESSKLGLKIQDVDPRSGRPPGVLITQVIPGSTAFRMELAEGMVITKIDGRPVRSAKELARMFKEAKSGSTLLLEVEIEGTKLLRALPVP